MALKETYDDNIFLTKNNAKADTLTTTIPALALQSNWDRHILFLGANAEKGSYRTHHEKNFSDHGLIASGQYDLTHGTFLTAALGEKQQHLSRGSEEDQAGADTIDFSTRSQTLGFTRALSTLQLKIFGKNEDTERLSEKNTLLANDYTKRHTQSLATTLSYVYMPHNEIFVSQILTRTRYDLTGGLNQDARSTDTQAGLNFDTTGLFKGSLYAGYLHRMADGGAANDRNHPYIGGTLDWNLTPLTTIGFSANTAYKEATLAANGGAVSHTYQASLKNSFTQRLQASFKAGLNQNDYAATLTSASRENTVYFTGIETAYKFSDNLGVKLGYDYKKRESTLDTENYTNNKALLSLTYMH